MAIYPTKPANFYFTYLVSQFQALEGSYEHVEQYFRERHSNGGPLLVVEEGRTPGETVKAQFHMGVVESMMPQAYRGAFLIALWGAYEATVIIVARAIEKAMGNRPDVPKLDFKTSWLDSALKHFPAHFGFPLLPTDIRNIQEEVVALQKIRNVFAHANGLEQVEETARHWKYLALKYAPKHEGIDLSKGFLEVSEDFVRSRFEMMRPVANHLIYKGREKLTELNVPHPLDERRPGFLMRVWQAVKGMFGPFTRRS